MSLKTQIETRIAGVIDTDDLAGTSTRWNQWLTDGAKTIINVLPGSVLWAVTQELTGSDTKTITLTGSVKVFQVERLEGSNWYRCRIISLRNYRNAFIDGSYVYCTAIDPGYVYRNGVIEVIPAAIDPANIHCLVVVYPSVNISNDSISGFIPDLELAVIDYGIASLATFRIDYYIDKVFNFSFPSWTSLSALDLSDITVPAYVGPPDIDLSQYSVPVLDTASLTIPSLGSNWFGQGADSGDGMLPGKTDIDSAVSNLGNYLTNVTTVFDEDEVELVNAAARTLETKLEQVKTRIEAVVRQWSNEVSSYTTELNERLGKFNAEITKYQTKITSEIQTHGSRSNEQVGSFSAEVQKYATEITAKVQEHNSSLQDNVTEVTTKLNILQQTLGTYINMINVETGRYQQAMNEMWTIVKNFLGVKQ